jgi:hypothetical protein
MLKKVVAFIKAKKLKRQIKKLKGDARMFYLAYEHEVNFSNCGTALYEVSRRGFNSTMDQLSKLDPDTPIFRLPKVYRKVNFESQCRHSDLSL